MLKHCGRKDLAVDFIFANRQFFRGPFLPGAIGALYTVEAQNVGTATHVGPVVVADLLPSFLTATAIEGAGWTCGLDPVRCDRSDDLIPGASHPPITVTANVATSARGSLINVAVVNGVNESRFDNMRSELCFSVPPPTSRQPVPSSPNPIALAGLALLALVGVLIQRRWKRA